MVPRMRSSRSAPLPRLGRVAGAGLLVLGCGSCGFFGGSSGMSREQALAAPATAFAQDAIEIRVRADAGLNPADGQAHTVVVAVLQAEQADVLRELATQAHRVEAALADGRAPAGVLQLTRFVVQPAQSCVLRLDRVQKARAVGLAVGYAQSGDNPPLRVFDIPLKVESTGWLSRNYTASTEPLRVQLELGPHDILNAGPLPAGPSIPPAPSGPSRPSPPSGLSGPPTFPVPAAAPASRPARQAPPVAPCQRLPPI